MTSKPDRILLTFWGTRGSIATPGRMTEKYGGNTACISLEFKDQMVILDAGTGIRNLGIEQMTKGMDRNNPFTFHLFLSHTHWDHIQGLPFFLPAYVKDCRITIYGSPKKERFLESVLKDQMDQDYFPVSMSAFEADIRIEEITKDVIHLGPIDVFWEEQVCHPGGSVSYCFQIQGKKIVYATDVELDRMADAESEKGVEGDLYQAYMDFIREADILIADGQFTAEEYAISQGWGHSSHPVLLDTAYRSRVKQVAVFHHDPRHSDQLLDQLWMENRSRYRKGKHKMKVFWAREGLTVSVD
jgi:phosphoribosyl 1,2-cyclic phosphodiesterase